MDASTALVLPDSNILIIEDTSFDRNPAAVYLASLSPGSRPTIKQALDVIARLISHGQYDAFTFNWSTLRFQHTAAIRSKLAEKYSPASGNKMLSAIRGVLRAARDLDLMTSEDYARAAAIKAIPGETLVKGRALNVDEIAALLEVCARDRSPRGARDAAMIAIMRAGGLRRAEVCNLDFADYDPERLALRVEGKLNKQREVPLSTDAATAIDDWVQVRGQDAGPLFCPVWKTGNLAIYQRLTPQAIYKCLARRAEEASISKFSPHDFRRTFVSDLLDSGADLSVVQKLAGHANVQTTARYDRRGEVAKRKAVSLLQTPYKSPRERR